MVILDWQLVSVLNSSIYDLSILLYICASVEDLEHIDDLLKTYYNSFHVFTKNLGSDPEKLFPYTVFEDHWKKFSLRGFTMVPFMMKLIYCKECDMIFEDSNDIRVYAKWIGHPILNNEEYELRLIGICKRFLCDDYWFNV